MVQKNSFRQIAYTIVKGLRAIDSWTEKQKVVAKLKGVSGAEDYADTTKDFMSVLDILIVHCRYSHKI